METITFWGILSAIFAFVMVLAEMILLGACLCLGFVLMRWIIAKWKPEMLVV